MPPLAASAPNTLGKMLVQGAGVTGTGFDARAPRKIKKCLKCLLNGILYKVKKYNYNIFLRFVLKIFVINITVNLNKRTTEPTLSLISNTDLFP